MSASGRLDKRLSVGLALEDGQTIPVRSDSAQEESIAVVQEVVGGDGGPDVAFRLHDVVDTIFRCDVLQDHAQFRIALTQGYQHPVNKYCFAVKEVDLGICHLAMHEQGQVVLLHGFQGGATTTQQICHACI